MIWVKTRASSVLKAKPSPRQQLLDLEINERAARLAKLVLWIGYLQWHIRTRSNKAVV